MDDILDVVFELILELVSEGLFALIRKYIKNKFLRGVLYVVTVLALTALIIGLMVLVLKLFSGCFL